MDARELAELQEAVSDTRRIVKSLSRHARTATQLLTDLEERLDRFENATAEEAQNGKIAHPAGARV
jgi:hypothetical protein